MTMLPPSNTRPHAELGESHRWKAGVRRQHRARKNAKPPTTITESPGRYQPVFAAVLRGSPGVGLRPGRYAVLRPEAQAAPGVVAQVSPPGRRAGPCPEDTIDTVT